MNNGFGESGRFLSINGMMCGIMEVSIVIYGEAMFVWFRAGRMTPQGSMRGITILVKPYVAIDTLAASFLFTDWSKTH